MEYLIIYLCIINIVAFILMGVDKSKAKNNRWRIRESVLFLVAAIGGSVGAILGMLIFRHKTKHKSFTIGLPLILIAQVVIVVVILLLTGKS